MAHDNGVSQRKSENGNTDILDVASLYGSLLIEWQWKLLRPSLMCRIPEIYSYFSFMILMFSSLVSVHICRAGARLFSIV